MLTEGAAVLLIAFGGITDRLIPLFAVGAFLAFTLSQAGMVAHWRRNGTPGSWGNMLINGVGAVVTALALAVILVAKFWEGAWMTLLIVPALLVLFSAVNRQIWPRRRSSYSTANSLINVRSTISLSCVAHYNVGEHRSHNGLLLSAQRLIQWKLVAASSVR